MEPRFNYLGLLIVIIIGVTASNLISNWITTKSIEMEASEAPVVLPKDISRNAKEKKQEGIDLMEPTIVEDPVPQEQLIKQRKYDDNGSRLAKNCNEWREADKAMNTQTTKREVAKHCEIYEKYVKTGELPQTN